MEFLVVLLVFGLVAAAQYIWGGARGRKGRQRPVPRPGASGYRRGSDANMLFYAAGDPNSMINGQMPVGSRCDDSPAGGDAGSDQGDCAPAPDGSDSDSYDAGESDCGDSDSGGWDSGGSDSGGSDSGGSDSGGGDSGGGDSSD